MKSQKDIEIRTLSMELASMRARNSLVEEKLANSVPLELYNACVAEKESMAAELARKEKQHREEVQTINDAHSNELRAVVDDCNRQLAAKDAEIEGLKSERKSFADFRALMQAENVDCQTLIKFWQSRQFGRSSETMVEEMDRLVGKLPESKAAFMADALAMIERINRAHGAPFTEPAPESPAGDAKAADPENEPKAKKRRRPWRKGLRCSDIRKIFDIDFSELPEGSKIAMRTVGDEKREEVTRIEVLHYRPASFYSEVFQVANCNVPGVDGTRQTVRPPLVFDRVPVDPSFARFYLEMKFYYNRSEGQILDYMHKLGCTVDQATLNRWMHTVMDGLMERLLPALEDEIRDSRFTHNDETRILVRVELDEDHKVKYRTKYIHGMLSPSKNLFIMVYEDGSRAHDVQLKLFEGSLIEAFTADRCALYTALQKEFEIPPIRGACWVHFRRYLLNAYHQDPRLEAVVQLLARLFFAERLISKTRNLTETGRVRERQDMCRPLVDAIFSFMQSVRDAGAEYGTLAQRAADYLLDDREGFTAFLDNGLVEISNNAIERCFRRLALGRRNWQQCGSHKAAEHTAFMYSLVESCEMNGIDFGDYIEHVLREINSGNEDYRSLLPNRITLPQKAKEAAAA